MDNKVKDKDTSSVEFDQDKHSTDYKFLLQKLKSIKESINLLEKYCLNKEI